MRKMTVRGMIYAAMFGAVTAIGAYIAIPAVPVPITLQTLFLNLAAVLLGGSLGALSQVIYVLLGIIGLPVFSGGTAGLGVLFGPTGGYLLGFIAGAFIIGKLVEMKKNPGIAWIIVSMLAGMVVIYIFGALQLSIAGGLSIKKAAVAGVLPFLPGDFLKIIIAALTSVKIKDKINI
ncbi:MAG: biotin transporter BioY [Clostridiales bacterium]|nr:biotin transporter BioY [Clostridiales bacterium]MCF8023101.1 biotin transporter BioY [Clostridiales bacterium]